MIRSVVDFSALEVRCERSREPMRGSSSATLVRLETDPTFLMVRGRSL